jgi:hypothetical protein
VARTSPEAAVDWQSFSVGASGHVNFARPGRDGGVVPAQMENGGRVLLTAHAAKGIVERAVSMSGVVQARRGLRKRADPSITLLAAGALFRDLCDLDVNGRDHHGTPDERIEAAEAGIAVGFEGHTLRTAIEEGIDYVLSM